MMGLFSRRENYYIQCSNRELKDLIDTVFGKSADAYYEGAAIILIKEAIRHRRVLEEILKNGYESHKSDFDCDIPNFETFIKSQQQLIRNNKQHERTTVCVEGYVFSNMGPYDAFGRDRQWTRDNACIHLYPIPCKSEAEREACADLNYYVFGKLKSIRVVCDYNPELEEGQHVRIHGSRVFDGCYDEYDEDDEDYYGNVPGAVSVLVRTIEKLD